MAPDEIHLDVREVGKSFGGTRALHDVSVEIRAGSVHAFVGENGAGKSPSARSSRGSSHRIRASSSFEETRSASDHPARPSSEGIALVAQEVALVPQRTVAENVFLGTEPRRLGFVHAAGSWRVREPGRRGGFEVPADAVVGTLPLAKQQQVEILRALARDAELIVFDEPTASLSATAGRAVPRDRPRASRASGRTVILVSHFISGALELADTITVLRDGQVVRTGPAAPSPRTRSCRPCWPVDRPDLPA